MKILIIANTRFKGGISGGDAIYESFIKYWPEEIAYYDYEELPDYAPFILCYVHRILLGVFRALFDNGRYDFVYSASDFLPDSLAGFVYKLKGKKWIAGYFLHAFKENKLHYYSQKVVRQLIKWYADMVIVTNPTMFSIFPKNRKTWINGGIDLSLAGLSDEPKIYDAVFCGRIHPSKGIDELIEIWEWVRKNKSNAKLAIIGDGDLGLDYIKNKLRRRDGSIDYMGIDLLGYMGEERYKIFKKSKIVLYPTPAKYDHFSMAPVEAMACGCPMVCFDTPVMQQIRPPAIVGRDLREFLLGVLSLIGEKHSQDELEDDYKYSNRSFYSWEWAQKFGYQKQSLRVLSDIKKELCL